MDPEHGRPNCVPTRPDETRLAIIIIIIIIIILRTMFIVLSL